MTNSLLGYVCVKRSSGFARIEFPEGISVISRELLWQMLKDEKGMFHEEEIVEVYIPDDVCVISDNAFRDCVNLRSVHLNSGGSNLHYIGQFSFCGCSSLYIFDKSPELRYVGTGSFIGTKVPCFNMIDRDLMVDYISDKAFERENGIRKSSCVIDSDICGILKANIGGVVDYA